MQIYLRSHEAISSVNNIISILRLLITGGWVAAPAARHIIQNAAPLLGIHPVDEKAPEIRRKLRLDFKIGKEEKTLASF